MFGLFDHLSHQIHLTFIGVAVLLGIAEAALLARRRRVPERDDSELAQRIRTWWVIVISFAILFGVSRTTAIVFFALVSFLALKEFLSMVPTRRVDHRVLFWAYLAIPLQYVWVGSEWYGMFIIFIPVYMFILLPTRMVMIGETSGFLRAVGSLQWGLMTTVYSLSHGAMLLSIQPPVNPRVAPIWPAGSSQESGGAALLVFLILLTQFNDVAQYCWGRALGETKIVPKVSPNKTVVGMLGGVCSTTVLAAAIGPWLTFMDLLRSITAGLIIGVFGFAGDLSVSALKRDLGVKDCGYTLPGHGGVLDRVDSLTFTAPLFFHFVYYFYG
ncbi:phosphatidate cytidylyltransferase [Roseiconus nitratireducens]|uniref:Phosphatidate cytidylyltransferase n=1 Tax=Roseiconus nitratireducens TaxID=2605748 RepID=A0A5M6CZY9_9BACT|nr:phosphatidate cytidylyltransferase [Roseiconus nitratireducens]KAA5539612.1 phosphatidate cytidylyltransferase [Roseiconus nitratireducens]